MFFFAFSDIAPAFPVEFVPESSSRIQRQTFNLGRRRRLQPFTGLWEAGLSDDTILGQFVKLQVVEGLPWADDSDVCRERGGNAGLSARSAPAFIDMHIHIQAAHLLTNKPCV